MSPLSLPEQDVEQKALTVIAAMDDADRQGAENVRRMIRRGEPDLTRGTWCGFPAST